MQGNNKIKSFLDDLSFGFQDGKRNGVLLPGNTPRQKGWENATPHIGSHPKYTNKVQRFLETASDAYYKELKAGADVTQTKEFFNAKLDRYLNSVKKGLMDGKVILNYK